MSSQKSGKEKQKPRHQFRTKKHEKRDEHHVYPRSRKKDGDLGKFKPLLRSLRLRLLIKKHVAWHYIFYNLFAEEVIQLIKKSFQEGEKSPAEVISLIKKVCCRDSHNAEATEKELGAWQEILNGYYSWRKIKKIIQKDWMYPGIKAIISRGKIAGVIIFLKNIPKKSRIIDDIYRCKDIQVFSLKDNQLLKII